MLKDKFVNWRINFLLLFFVVFASVIAGRLFYLQVYKGEDYKVLAAGQQISLSERKGERGEVFFSDGETILAKSKRRFLFRYCPHRVSVEDKDKLQKALIDVLQKDEETSIALIEQEKCFNEEISQEQFSQLKFYNISGTSISSELVRFYPQKEMACHISGFSNNDGSGQYGIENYFDKFLIASESFLQKLRSPFGYLSSLFDVEKVKDSSISESQGDSLQLTLDYNIQYFAEKLLKEARKDWAIDKGQIIVYEPSTGKVVAMALWPSFDLNEFGKQKDASIFLNHATQLLYEPGSVFKPFVMAAGLQEGLIEPDTIYEDKGSVYVGGPLIYNFDRRVWGWQTMTDVLEESINTGIIFVEQLLGKEKALGYYTKFGFFEKTGIDLQGEVTSKNETLKKGYPRDFATASFGQGIQMTSIQLVRAFGALANQGVLMKPYLVEKIINSKGEIQLISPQEQGQAINQETARKINEMLVSVVENGSGRLAQIKGYSIAGKTGTSQVPKKGGGYEENNTIQSFVGYFPAYNPRFLIFVRLDNPKGSRSASRCAVPIFKTLAQDIINFKNIPPDKE